MCDLDIKEIKTIAKQAIKEIKALRKELKLTYNFFESFEGANKEELIKLIEEILEKRQGICNY